MVLKEGKLQISCQAAFDGFALIICRMPFPAFPEVRARLGRFHGGYQGRLVFGEGKARVFCKKRLLYKK
ncbi:MAG TPA: hypothetical protein VNK95_07465 [Caldilineaceae bacterium]|nr:hypothetical protein [Caldilineaceae bacterium]